MRAVRAFFSRLGAALLMTIAVVLPYGARAALGRALAATGDRDRLATSRVVRWNARFWNVLLLGLVFGLALPVSKLVFLFGGRRRLAPRAGAETFWVPREPPEDYVRDVGEPF